MKTTCFGISVLLTVWLAHATRAPAADTSTGAPPNVVPAVSAGATASSRPTTLPIGTILLVRLENNVSSKAAGAPFTAKLEFDLATNGAVALKAGTTIYGKVRTVPQGGRGSGTSLDLRLTQIVVGGQRIPIVTSGHSPASPAAIARAAAASGRKDSAGDAGKSPAAAASPDVIIQGRTITVPSGTLLEFLLTQPVTLPSAKET